MFEIVYRYDPDQADHEERPADASQALARLVRGNEQSVAMRARVGDPGAAQQDVITLDGSILGITDEGGVSAPCQEPFAAILSCADARVPPEIVFRRALNDLFIVRVAGNVIAAEGIGSLAYAAHHLGDSLKLIVVLGHSGCGAVTAAVDAYLTPSAYPEVTPAIGLRSIVDRIFIAVRSAAIALDEAGGLRPGDGDVYRDALIRMAIVLNAAQTAMSVRQFVTDVISVDRKVVFGVYDLATGSVDAPRTTGGSRASMEPGLVEPPTSLAQLEQLAAQLLEDPGGP